jgi:F-type H+-transporting ATPase subunit b
MATETHETTAAAEHPASGGLPQFDFQWWPGQMAWLVIVFVVVLAFMRLFAVPKLGGTIMAREERITGDLAEARRLKDEADAQAQAAERDRAQARTASQKVANDARAKARAEIDAALAAEEARLAATAATADAAIAKARDAAMTNVASIAEGAATAIVGKLTGKAASAAELAQARG